jgi:uncharacterized protein (TIGR03437 family)
VKKVIACHALFFGFILNAQLIVDTVAGGKVPSGVPAQDVNAGTSGSFTKDAAGNIVFVSLQYTIQRINEDGTIETIAGTGQSGFSGDGGPATQARLNGPSNPRYNKSGNLYFVDGFRIRSVDRNGVIATLAGTGIQGALGGDGAATSAQIDYIYGMEFDGAGNLYFAEPNQIRRLDPDGQLQVVAKIGGGPMTMDGSGNFYLFLGQGGEDLYRVAPDGSSKLVAGYRLTGNNSFRRFQTIAATADSAGNIYVLQENDIAPFSYKIWRITPDMKFSEYVASGLQESTGDIPVGQITAIAPGDNGALYFADGNRIRAFAPPSTVQTLAGRNFKPALDRMSARNASLYYPQAIAVSRTGDLYIAEGCVIRKVGPDGVLGTVGSLPQCILNTPLAADSKGRVFLLSIDNSTGPPYPYGVASLLPNGAVSILPGSTNIGLIGAAGTLNYTVDSSDRLYILSTSGLHRWSANRGMETLDWDKKLVNNGPPVLQMSIDSSDNLYLENNSRQIFRVAPDGTSSLIATFPTQPRAPIGPFAVDPAGRIWTSVPVPYLQGGLLRGLGILGTSTVTEIIPCCGYSGDGGPAMSARMSTYTSIVASTAGEIYTLNPVEGFVRKVSGGIPAARPVISAAGVVNAASLQGGAIAPGELISIFGTNFGQLAVQSFVLDNNTVPGALGNVAVFFNGQRGAITGAAPNQLNVFVPYEIASSQNVAIRVVVDGATSDPLTIPVVKTAFGLSTANASGSGQGAIFNQDGSPNSNSNPAAAGTIITLFGTGEGITTPLLPDGALVISTPFSMPAASVAVTIGGQRAEVAYAGAAPLLPIGVLQINARIPEGLPAGDALITVSMGGVDTTRRVTCAVR